MDTNISSTIAALCSKISGQLNNNLQSNSFSDYFQKIPILDSICHNQNEKVLINQIYQVQQMLRNKKDLIKLPEALAFPQNHHNEMQPNAEPFLHCQPSQNNRPFMHQNNPNPVIERKPNQVRMNKPVNRTATAHQPLKNHENHNGGLVSSLIEGCVIAGFNVWGEKRICLPHLLRFVLNEVDIERIGLACSKLKITCSKCTSTQLKILHDEKVLPRDVQVCGLMRKSDAERLVKYLKNQKSNGIHEGSENRMICVDSDDDSEDEGACGFWSKEDASLSKSFENVSSSDEMVDVVSEKRAQSKENQSKLEVIHECFGKQRGYLLPELYLSPTSLCIECKTCKKLFNPMQFVGHTHGLSEVDMNHWGFDSTNWRCYLRAYRNSSKDININLHKTRSKVLEDFKVKFLKPINLPSKLLNALKKCKDDPKTEEEQKETPREIKDKNPALITRVLPNLTLRRIWAPNDGEIVISSPEKIREKSIHRNLQHGTPLLENSNRVWNLEYAASFGKSFVPNVSLKVCPENCRIPFSKSRCDVKLEKVNSKESPWYSGSESLASSSNSLNRSRDTSGPNQRSQSILPGLVTKVSRTRSLSHSRVSDEDKKASDLVTTSKIRKSRSLSFISSDLHESNKLSPVTLPNSDENHNNMFHTNTALNNKFHKAMTAAYQAQRIAKAHKNPLLSIADKLSTDPDTGIGSFIAKRKQQHSLPPHVLGYESLWSQVNMFINQFSNHCCNEVNKLVTDFARVDSTNVSPILKSIVEQKFHLQENIYDLQKNYLDQVQKLYIENSALRDALDNNKSCDSNMICSYTTRSSQEKSNSTREFEADSSGIQQIFSQENSPCANTGITNSTSSPASTDENSQLKVHVVGSYDCLMPPHKKRYKMTSDLTSF